MLQGSYTCRIWSSKCELVCGRIIVFNQWASVSVATLQSTCIKTAINFLVFQLLAFTIDIQFYLNIQLQQTVAIVYESPFSTKLKVCRTNLIVIAKCSFSQMGGASGNQISVKNISKRHRKTVFIEHIPLSKITKLVLDIVGN